MEQLTERLQDARLAENRLLAMGLRLSLDLARKYCNVHSADELADLVNEGLLVFLSSLEWYEPARGVRLSTYSYSKIKSRFIELNRSDKLVVDINNIGEVADRASLNPGSQVESRDKEQKVHEALMSLTERQRVILMKRFGICCDELTVSDIARTLGVSCDTVRREENVAILVLKENHDLKPLVA